MTNVSPARTERSALIVMLLRVRAITYVLVLIPMLMSSLLTPEERLVAAIIAVAASLIPVLAARVHRSSEVAWAAGLDLFVGFGIFLVAPSASGLSLLVAMWAIAYTVLLGSVAVARWVAVAAVALQLAKTAIAALSLHPTFGSVSSTQVPSPYVLIGGAAALGGAYLALAAVCRYVSGDAGDSGDDAPYRSLMDTAPIPFVVVVDGSIVYLNHACATLLGFTPDDLLSTQLAERIAPDSQQAFRRLHKRVVRKLRSVDRVTVNLLASDGTERTVDMSANPIDHGEALALQIMMFDRTAQHAAEEELRQTRMDYQQFFERIPVALYRSRPDGRIAHVNQAAVELLGASHPSEIIGTSADDYYVTLNDRDQLSMMLSDDGVVAGYEWEMRRKDGTTRWIRDTSRLIETPHGRYFEGAMVDVTARRNVEEELWSRAVQQEAAASVGQLALETDDLESVCEILSDVVGEVLSASAVGVIHRNEDGQFGLIGAHLTIDPAELSGIADRAHMSAAPVTLRSEPEVRFAAPGVLAAGYCSGVALMVPSKEIDFGTLVVLCDTERVFSSDDMNFLHSVANVLAAAVDRTTAYSRLEALVASKDAFVASVSHELRTPLTVVTGLAHELAQQWRSLSEEEMDEFMLMLVGQSLDMADLIEDLLVAARSNIGNVTVQVQDLDVEVQVHDVLAGFDRQTSVPIAYDVGPGHIEADGVRFRQILRNLIANAIKYGGDEIAVHGFLHSGAYVVEVRDNGAAIPEADQERIFEPYERAHDSTGRPGSVGLGLAVSRTLAELMRGSLTYRHDGQSVFRLELPAEGSTDEAPGSRVGDDEVMRALGAVGTSRIGVDIGSIQ